MKGLRKLVLLVLGSTEPAQPASHPSEDVGRVPRYATKPVRPVAQLAVRTALWAAVALGAFGGAVALLRPATASTPSPAVDDEVDGDQLPAPVAGVAERAVEAWLTASDGDEASLKALFVEPPPVRRADDGGLTVGRLDAVAGRRLADGYWAVTVAAEVAELASAGLDGGTSGSSTWFVEVGIVGGVDSGLAALATPAVVPAPGRVSSEWQPLVGAREPDGDDPLVATIDGFLRALLTGTGDLSRYMSSTAEESAVSPSPFNDVVVQDVRLSDLGADRSLARTQVQATTPGGTSQVLAYEIALALRAGRWEVTGFSGVPSLAGSVEPTSSPDPVAGPGT